MNNSSSSVSKKKNSSPSQGFSLCNVMVNYFILVMFVIFPLFVNLTFDGSFPFLHFDRGYYGIRHQKYYLFMIMGAITVIGEILLLFTEGSQKIRDKYNLHTRDDALSKLSFTDWAVLAFLFTVSVSTIFSAYKEMAFFGEITAGSYTHGRNNGLMLFMMYAAVYFLVSRAYRYKEYIFVALAITSAFVGLVAVLNCFYIDPLNMFERFVDDEKVFKDFITTFGNKNMYSTYICVTLPVVFTMSVCTEKLVCRIVYLVSAFTGLGAPYWDMYARGAIVGITRGASKAHIVRAGLEGIAYQVKDMIDAMEKDSGAPMQILKVDGGAYVNRFLMQFQADILRCPIDRPAMVETTALGAAFLAGLCTGVWSDVSDVTRIRQSDHIFRPKMDPALASAYCDRWHQAVKRAQDWE